MKNKLLRQLIMLSKLTFYGIFVQCLFYGVLIAADLEAQKIKTVHDVYIQFEEKESELSELFQHIESNSNFQFTFYSGDFDLNQTIKTSKKKQSVSQVLMLVSKEANLSFRQVNNNINVQKNKNREVGKPIQVIIQGVTITGKVTSDEDQSGLPGVNVIVKGTTQGTVTDVEGMYSLEVPGEEAVLVFSSVGYKQIEIIAGSQTVIDITMQSDITALEELVVIGYGTQKRSDLTGAISSLPGEGLDKLQIGNPSQLLQGRMAGVSVEANGGGPGATTNIIIRGTSSLTNANPLFVIDGMFTDNMDFLNPSDIKSIEVLKDASAAAIYGSRAANGVIIITTNNGAGLSEIRGDFEFSYGIQQQIKKLDWISGAEYADVRNALSDANGQDRWPGFTTEFDPSVNTIIDEIAISEAPVTNMIGSVYGGANDVNFNISANWFKQEGIIVASDYDRKTFRANVGINKEKWQLNQSFTFSHVFRRPNTIWNLNNNILPTIPHLNPDNLGGYGGASLDIHGVDGNNHIGRSLLWDRHYESDNLLGNLNFKYEIIEGLMVGVNGGIHYVNGTDYTYYPEFYISNNIDANRSDAELNEVSGKYVSGLFEGTLNYTRLFGKHSIDVLAGITLQETNNKRSNIWVSDFPSNDIRQISAANNVVQVGGTEVVSTLSSQFGRINYNYDSRYFISGTIRRDGSSRFSEDNRWGTFPSVSAAWTLSNESFLANSNVFSNLKVRASYGELGSQNIVDYAFIPVLNINSDAVFGAGQGRIPGVSQTVFANPNLVWETTKTSNIGLDLGFIENRLTFTVDYFIKNSEDILVSLRIPPTSGTTTPVAQNAASMENKGLELTGAYSIGGNDWDLTIGGNATFLKNEVTDLGDNIAPIAGGAYGSTAESTLTDTGHPIASFYGWKVIGIYQTQDEINADGEMADPQAEPGDFRYEDIDGDEILSVGDKTHLGSYIPDVSYGFTVSGTYKNFDYDLIFNGVSGNEIWNMGRGRNLLQFGNSNVVREALNYWTPENTDTDLPRIGGGANNGRPSSFYIEDGSYFRLRNIQIGYSIPLGENSKVRKIRVYGSVQNLFTISNYSGYYPEIGRNKDDELRVVNNPQPLFYAGVDQSAYPVPRTFIIGVQFGF